MLEEKCLPEIVPTRNSAWQLSTKIGLGLHFKYQSNSNITDKSSRLCPTYIFFPNHAYKKHVGVNWFVWDVTGKSWTVNSCRYITE